MKKQIMKRSIALVMSLMVFSLFTFAFSNQADASAKKKTVYLKTSAVTTYKTSGGTDKITIKYKYDKNGLLKEFTDSGNPEGSRSVYTRNKAGQVTSIKSYGGDGKLSDKNLYTLDKKGRVKTIKYYRVQSGKSTLQSTSTLTYKNGKLSKWVVKGSEGTTTSTYWTNGNLKKNTYKSDGYNSVTNYNKKGQAASSKSSLSSAGYSTTSSTTYKHSQNKKKNPTKVTTKYTQTTTTNGTVTTTNTTETEKFTYNKAGMITKRIYTVKSKSGGKTTYSYSSTTVYKYKKVKVPTKYLKYVGD